jgi:hypothetical protein
MFEYNMFMKSAVIFVFLLLSAACAVNTVESQKRTENPQPEVVNSKAKQPVLVELFTSEGCSSCPPADRALAFLEKEQPSTQAEIITLALHVDYWNYLGWKDVYSSPIFTERQNFYSEKFNLDSIYTPQMVVDGSREFVGNDSGKAAKVINEAAQIQKAKVELTKNDDKLTVKISEIPKHENTTVYLAIAEDNLVSNVARGENSGRKLEHQSVVRELKNVGNLTPQQNSSDIETAFQINAAWKRENLKLIVFAQEDTTGKIIGLGRIHL